MHSDRVGRRQGSVVQTGTGPELTVGLLHLPGLSPNTAALLGRTCRSRYSHPQAREAENPQTCQAKPELSQSEACLAAALGAWREGLAPRIEAT